MSHFLPFEGDSIWWWHLYPFLRFEHNSISRWYPGFWPHELAHVSWTFLLEAIFTHSLSIFFRSNIILYVGDVHSHFYKIWLFSCWEPMAWFWLPMSVSYTTHFLPFFLGAIFTCSWAVCSCLNIIPKKTIQTPLAAPKWLEGLQTCAIGHCWLLIPLKIKITKHLQQPLNELKALQECKIGHAWRQATKFHFFVKLIFSDQC